MQGFLTVNETAAELRVSRSTIYRMFRSGELRWVTVAGRRRVPREALQELADGGGPHEEEGATR
jgi:excisionase family DNA binding protein